MAGALTALTLAGTLSVMSTEASAGWRRGWGWRGGGGAVAAGVVGGLALGAIAANAYRPYYGYPAGYYYGGPGYGYGAGCYARTRNVWVDGWGWQARRVTVCN